jgi:excisionase family DNA binding protein
MLGISLRTAQLWVESGQLEAWKTEGGHRRIERASIERLLVNPPPPAAPGAGSADHARAIAPHVDTGAFQILVVEDQEDLLKLYRINIGRWPLQPRLVTASNGFDALIKIGNERPDMMIADLFMPDFDGFMMLNSIRSVPEYSDMPIVVVTGLSPEDIATKGELPKDVAVFSKPIPFEQLERLAEELAARKKHGA